MNIYKDIPTLNSGIIQFIKDEEQICVFFFSSNFLYLFIANFPINIKHIY